MRTPLILLFLCCFLGLQAQTNFLPGLIITNEGDTLHGLIDYRSDYRNARKCEFIREGSDSVQEFLPFSIQGYRFKDSKYYVSHEVTVKGQKTNLFLEYLVHGICNLYFYGDSKWYHYFLEKEGGPLTELTNEEKEVYVKGKTYLKYNKKYIGTLKYTFIDCPQLMPLIEKAVLDHESLINIVKKYHEYMCDDYRCIIYQKQLPAVSLKLGASVVFNSSFLKFNNDPMLETLDFGTTLYPSLEIMLNTALPRASEKLSFQLSGEFSRPYFHGTGLVTEPSAFEEVHIRSLMLKGRAGFKYTWPKGKFRPTLMLGANYGLLANTNARRVQEININSHEIYTRETNDVPVPKTIRGLNADLGIDYISRASFIPFITLGYETGYGNSHQLFSKEDDLHLNTLKLHAGIIF